MISPVPPPCQPSFRLLSEEQIRHLHRATLELLDTTGVRILEPQVVRMMADAGCRITDKNMVRIPEYLVDKAIQSAPSRIQIYNRAGMEAMCLADRRIHFGMGTDLVHTIDLESGQLRPSRLTDVQHAAWIADSLEEIDFIGSYALPSDVTANLMYIDSFLTQVEHSVKPIFFTAGGSEDLQFIHTMAAAVVGGEDTLREKPFLIHYAEPLTPLTHTAGAIRKLLFCADKGIPVTYAPGMMSGASAPVTLAGAIVTGNAEALSGLVIHQLRAPGAPIISGFGMSTFDMKTSACVYACPEYRLALSACADLYHHYKIPMWGTAGVSDAVHIDQQAGMEWALSLMNAALDGANLVHDVGYLGQGLVGHPAALVMCAEIISWVKRMVRGFEIGPRHLALDLIGQVGPQGEFLSSDHTLEFFRTEHWQPRLCNRIPPNTVSHRETTTWAERAIERSREILSAKENRNPLGREVLQSLTEIRKQAEIEIQDIRFVS